MTLANSPIETIPPAPLRRRRWVPFNVALILPAQLVMLVVVVAPTLIVIWLAFTDWQPTQAIAWYRAETVGLWNFYDLWYDTRFVNAVVRTALVVAVCVSIELVLALGLALLFLDEWAWRKIAVSVIILPMMIIPVDAANAFFMIFNEHGPLNHVVSLVLGRPFEFSWLSHPTWAMFPIMLSEIWQWTPLMFLLVLTGMIGLPQNQLRAALMLGASLTPVLAIAVLIRSIETFKIFDAVYILTRGQPGGSTETISMYMYNGAFVYFRMGYIAAAALIVLILVIASCLALIRPMQRHG
jgi:multiple sugar transport system permease protein